MCFRSLAELTIENPPTSSTLIFVCGGPLEPPRVSSSLSESEPDTALARLRDGPPLVLPRGGGGGGGCGATVFFFVFFVFFFFDFFWVALELLLDDDDDDDPEPLVPPSDPNPSQSGIEIQPPLRYVL